MVVIRYLLLARKAFRVENLQYATQACPRSSVAKLESWVPRPQLCEREGLTIRNKLYMRNINGEMGLNKGAVGCRLSVGDWRCCSVGCGENPASGEEQINKPPFSGSSELLLLRIHRAYVQEEATVVPKRIAGTTQLGLSLAQPTPSKYRHDAVSIDRPWKVPPGGSGLVLSTILAVLPIAARSE
ncbi:hypothetical protein PAAG_11271 [Paracoccidioides lutzii Pb01]|uniref:Uncharacterized protein n=1 Tax=Paracoccidioides lutzii (strain ATCC MYA-826 / Pb01) TaxID=502779 RepID=A0A0A2V313_PARBA|nr:hypothetical protein PAAG_11271 [Paracoccidioides lutzii Pb01]KGQ01883.1 hypothetical protein PAAG_11271 [Paracoccidioides lutzii Pb01]